MVLVLSGSQRWCSVDQHSAVDSSLTFNKSQMTGALVALLTQWPECRSCKAKVVSSTLTEGSPTHGLVPWVFA